MEPLSPYQPPITSTPSEPKPITMKLRRTQHETDRAIWMIFSKYCPVEGNEEIDITGQVLGDGKGDWAAMRKYQKYLHKTNPNRPVRIIASSATKWEGKLDVSNKESEPADLTFYGDNSRMGSDIPLSAFPLDANITEKLERAGLIIEAGVPIGGIFNDELKDKIEKNGIRIFEHDFRTGSWSKSFAKAELNTGIGYSNNFIARDGILLNSNTKEYQWEDLTNTNLKQALFETPNPSKDNVDDYLLKNICFLGYMSTNQSNSLFIGESILFANANIPEKSVDICLPNIVKNKQTGLDESLIEMIKNLRIQGNRIENPKIQNWDISHVKVIWYDGDKQLESIIPIAEGENNGKGKEVRIIDPGSLSAKDFKKLISLSAPLVGCTGDNSLAETLSVGKIPSYEPRFQEKVKALLLRVGHEIGYDSVLYKYCEWNEFNHNYPNITICNPKLAEDAKKFGEAVREKLSFKPLLKGAVNEKLLRNKDADFAQKEDVIRQKYLNNEISNGELENQLMDLLAEKGMKLEMGRGMGKGKIRATDMGKGETALNRAQARAHRAQARAQARARERE